MAAFYPRETISSGTYEATATSGVLLRHNPFHDLYTYLRVPSPLHARKIYTRKTYTRKTYIIKTTIPSLIATACLKTSAWPKTTIASVTTSIMNIPSIRMNDVMCTLKGNDESSNYYSPGS